MSNKSDLRRAVAEFVTDHVSGVTCKATLPAQMEAHSAYVATQTPYLDLVESGATYRKNAVLLRIVLVAPAFDWEQRHDWLDDRFDELAVAWRDAADIGGFVKPRLKTATAAYVAEQQALLGMSIDLTPIIVKEI